MNRSNNFTLDQVIYEDNHLIAINKRSGQIVQGDKTGDTSLLEQVKQYIKVKYNKPGDVFLNLVHRIDRPVTGVLLFARTSKATERLNKAFQNREIKKTYWALTKNKPKQLQARLEHHILRDRKNNVSKALMRPKGDVKKGVLSYAVLKIYDGKCLLEVKPETGRHHQIRAQLSAMQCPIIGDLKYHYPKPNADKSICLHAKALELMHPVKKEKLVIQAPIPKVGPWQGIK